MSRYQQTLQDIYFGTWRSKTREQLVQEELVKIRAERIETQAPRTPPAHTH